MKNNYTVYMHISPSRKKYIGITSQKPEYRWNNGKGYKNNEYLNNAINKYGWDNFEHIIVAKGLTEDEAKWLEIELIRINETTDRTKGYNISLGGSCGNHTEETKEKISKTLIGYKHTEETKEKMRIRFLGENNPNYGKDLSGKNNPSAKSVICLTTKKIFFTLEEGAKFYNIHKENICKCCKGERKSTGKHNGQKLVWRYLIWKHNKTYKPMIKKSDE